MPNTGQAVTTVRIFSASRKCVGVTVRIDKYVIFIDTITADIPTPNRTAGSGEIP